MIAKTNRVCNEQTAATVILSSLPHGNLIPSAKILNREDDVVKGLENDTISRDRISMGMGYIQMRLVIPLMFAFLPGLTQLPSLARSAVPDVVTQAPSTMDPDELLGRRRTMDAARLTLEDYSGRKGGKIPTSVKKQIDMQDRRLAICQEMSKDEWEWEQCFYYGTTNGGGGAMYFDGGMLAENDSATKTAAKLGKQKIPTW
mmetsp:Transcript_7431/g.18210  ORF Transcript_7431/g.18210 Transcript_7431/m.18210 type:complete len:202 (+) Transcript_7431:68-673(+)